MLIFSVYMQNNAISCQLEPELKKCPSRVGKMSICTLYKTDHLFTTFPSCFFGHLRCQFHLVRILWIILVSNWIDIFPTLLGHFSTLVPIDNLLHYSAYTPKKSAFYANWFGNAKQLNKKWKILKEIHFFNSASAFFQLWLRMCFSKNPFPCVPFLWKNQLQFPSR